MYIFAYLFALGAFIGQSRGVKWSWVWIILSAISLVLAYEQHAFRTPALAVIGIGGCVLIYGVTLAMRWQKQRTGP